MNDATITSISNLLNPRATSLQLLTEMSRYDLNGETEVGDRVKVSLGDYTFHATSTPFPPMGISVSANDSNHATSSVLHCAFKKKKGKTTSFAKKFHE